LTQIETGPSSPAEEVAIKQRSQNLPWKMHEDATSVAETGVHTPFQEDLKIISKNNSYKTYCPKEPGVSHSDWNHVATNLHPPKSGLRNNQIIQIHI